MRRPNDFVRELYPIGQRVELLKMDDQYTTLKKGDKGTVTFVDSMNTIHINWDNGSTLGVIHGIDSIKKIGGKQNGNK